MKYEDYLKTKHWIKFRVKARSFYKVCAVCSSDEDLQVHHKHYKSMWHEQLSDVELLCSDCHRATHIEKVSSIAESFDILKAVEYGKSRTDAKSDYVEPKSYGIKEWKDGKVPIETALAVGLGIRNKLAGMNNVRYR